MNTRIVYEQPLNERIRSLMRLNFLFQQVEHYLSGDSIWDSRAALASLLDIQNLVGRSDLKTEVLKELERHTANLAQLEQNPDVDRTRLAGILDELDVLIDRLYSDNQPIGHELKQNEFLNSVRQRVSVPGGTCEFDLPGFHYWLQNPTEARLRDLGEWLQHFDLLRNAIDIILGHIRESALPRQVTATEGIFQQNMDANTPCQILRIALPASSPFYPEVSAGKHRFTVRFLEPVDFDQKPKQTKEDVNFEMACCII